MGLIQEEFALEYLIKLVKGIINTDKYYQLTTTKDNKLLESLAINTLITEAASVFMSNEDAILKVNLTEVY